MNFKKHRMGFIFAVTVMIGFSFPSFATTSVMPANLEKSVNYICEKVKRFDTLGSYFSTKKNTLKNIVKSEYDLVTSNKSNIEDMLRNKYIFLGENHLDVDGMINNAIVVRQLNRLAKAEKKSIILLMESVRFSGKPTNIKVLAANSLLPRAIITYEKLTFDTQNFDEFKRPVLGRILADLNLNDSDKMDMDGWDNPYTSDFVKRNETLSAALNRYKGKYDHIVVIAGARHLYPSVVLDALSGGKSQSDNSELSLAISDFVNHYGVSSDPLDASFSGYLLDPVENLDSDPDWDSTLLEKSVRNHAPYLSEVMSEPHAVLLPRSIYQAHNRFKLSTYKNESSKQSLSSVREEIEKMDYFKDFMSLVTSAVWKSKPEENVLEDIALKRLLP